MILGCAQFGQQYGITEVNPLTQLDAFKILVECQKSECISLDAADTYGECLDWLSSLDLSNWKVTIKMKVNSFHNEEALYRHVQNILFKLKKDKLDCLMIHDTGTPIQANQSNWLNSLQDCGLVSEIGISIYEYSDIEKFFSRVNFKSVQAPVNVFDKRITDRWEKDIDRLKNKRLIARSIFLQGLLLGTPIGIDGKISRDWDDILCYWEKIHNYDTSRKIETCLLYIYNIEFIHDYVVGFNNLKQLKQFLDVRDRVKTSSLRLDSYSCITSQLDYIPDSLVDPRKWNVSR